MRKALLAVSVLALNFLAACANTNGSATVVDDQNSKNSGQTCYGQAIPKQYNVLWKDGSLTRIHYDTSDQVREQFLSKHLNEIELIEQDRHMQFHTESQAGVAAVDPVPIVTGNWGQSVVGAYDLWSQGITGEGVLVAVVDSGVDTMHAQLVGQIAINNNEIPNNNIDDDGNGLVDDYLGYDFYNKNGDIHAMMPHGTHVSGIILADSTKGSAVGMAPHARLLPLNFMDDTGAGDLGDAVLAIKYAALRGAKIINASWGGGTCSVLLQNTIQDLNTKGILFVVAAGNEGQDIDQLPQFPASFDLPNQITVGAITDSLKMASFSNYGKVNVHLMAPGYQIYSTYPGNSYAKLDGTSMATPFVAGAAALLWSAKPKATLDQIKRAILAGVDNGTYLVQTKGRLDVKRALQELQTIAP